jgi:hypothetical protein
VLLAVTSGRFSAMLIGLIVGNTLVLAMERYDASPGFQVHAQVVSLLSSESTFRMRSGGDRSEFFVMWALRLG